MNLQLLNEMMDNSVEVEGLGHWATQSYLVQENPVDHFGFVYVIKNKKTGHLYIGKKQTKHGGKKSSKNYGKETNWKSYEGSSKHLTEQIKEFGKDNFKFVILELYSTRGGLNYCEIAFQTKCNVLTERLPDSDERLFLNAQIGAVRWIPKEFWTDEERLMFVGENNGFYGKTHTAETKKLLSDYRKGMRGKIPRTPEWNKAISEGSMKGLNHHNSKGAIEGTCVKTGDVIICIGRTAVEKAGFEQASVYRCVNEKQKTHKGYTWKRKY